MNKCVKKINRIILTIFCMLICFSVLNFGVAFAESEKTEFNNDNLLELEKDQFIYNGNSITVSNMKYDGKVITEGIDFDAIYENNINASQNGFNAKITLTGKGKYTGILIKEFIILPQEIVANDIEIKDIAILHGEAATVEPTIKVGEKILIKNTDYTLEFTENDVLGYGKVKIKGKGNYSGEIEKSFEIRQNNLPLKNIDFEDKYFSELIIVSDLGFKDNTHFTISKVENSIIDMEKRLKKGLEIKGFYDINITEEGSGFVFNNENYVRLKIKYSQDNKSLKGGYVYYLDGGEVNKQHLILQDGYFHFTVKGNGEFVLVGKNVVNPLVYYIIGGLIIVAFCIWLIIHSLKRTIIFKENGGFVIENMTKVKGRKIKLPIAQRSNYKFNGWYLDEKCTVPFRSNTMPNYDIVLYAAWIKKKSNVH